MPYAILSVSDKTGIAELARALHRLGWTLLSTGGTGQTIREADVPVRGISQFTGFPEILGGRVKTLHPAVHAGLLARLSVEGDVRDLQRHDLEPVGMVVVNLYPFRDTVARPETTLAEALEQIDIGGPTMLRAAAKPRIIPSCGRSAIRRTTTDCSRPLSRGETRTSSGGPWLRKCLPTPPRTIRRLRVICVDRGKIKSEPTTSRRTSCFP